MAAKDIFYRLLKNTGLLDELINENKKLNSFQGFPPGHFYSPIVNSKEILARSDEIWINADRVNGVELNVEQQLSLVRSFIQYYPDLPYLPEKNLNTRYYFDNDYYTQNDGIILYSMIRYLKPKRIIEIGSGFSSAIMLDTNNHCMKGELELCFIDPYPERLNSLLNENDRKNCTVLAKTVQSVPLEIYKSLEAGDILFIDSSHVVKTGSDLHHILFKIIPVLNKGVFIHFHDIFFPFEYPRTWVESGRNWNENYLLHAFLMYNSQFRIRLFSDYIYKKQQTIFWEMPLAYNIQGTSLWIEKHA